MEMQLDAVDYANAMPFVRRASETFDLDTVRVGELGPLGGHPENQVVRAGPVRFLSSWRSDQPSLIEAAPSRSDSLKLLVLDAGHIATVRVPRSERKRLALMYELTSPPGGRTYYVIADGDAAVTFEACKGDTGPRGARQLKETQFNGSMMVTRRACFDPTVVADGKVYKLAWLSV
jgi:hypothetical protein